MRQIVVDTETTGLYPNQGHKLTEIGCIEIIDRVITGRSFHTYLNPERELDQKAIEITGLRYDFLKDKPKFSEIVQDFLEFTLNSELIIHNAPFDVGFINHELRLINHAINNIEQHTKIIDTLELARQSFPGQRNSLDALCKRLQIDNSHREFHGALLDANILAKVYLAMTAGQVSFELLSQEYNKTSLLQQCYNNQKLSIKTVNKTDYLIVLKADINEIKSHQEMLAYIKQGNGGICLFDDN